MRPRVPRIFYGWIVVLAGGVIGAMNSGFYYYGFGTFFTPLTNEFGWTRAELSGAFSISRFEGGLIGPVAGVLIDRFGPSRIIAIGVIIIGIGFILISQIHDLLVFYIVFIAVLSVGNSFGTSLPSMAAVSNWFIRRRGLAVGVLMGIFGVGGSLGAPLLGWLIGNFGWRTAAIVAGLLFWIVGLPMSRLIFRRPEERGYLPDGELPAPALSGAQASVEGTSRKPLVAEAAFTPRQAFACSSFWIMSAAFSIRHLVSSAVAVHEAPFLVDRGYTLEQASALLGCTVLASVFGRLFWGWLGDKMDRRTVLAICHFLMGIGVLLMMSILDAQSLERVIAFILVFGVGYGGTVPVSIAILADYFGRRNYATIQGSSSVVTMFGNISGPFLAGYVFDISQSYVMAFFSFAVITLATIPLFWAIRRPAVLPGKAGVAPTEASPARGG